MIFHSVKLMNYKSIGEENCELIIEPNITSIIGKNESGKSNVISALSEIGFTHNMNNTFLDSKVNRLNLRNEGSEITFIITLKFTEEEEKLYGVATDTIITIDKNSNKVSGGLVEYYNKEIVSKLQKFYESMKGNPLNLSSDVNTKILQLNSLINKNEILIISNIASKLTPISQAIDSAKLNFEELNIFLEAYSMFENLIASLPTIFLCNSNKILKQQYSHDEVQKELGNPNGYPNSLLSNFVNIIGVKNEEFISATATGSSAIQAGHRRRIEKQIDLKFNKIFNEFYSAESIRFQCEFNTGQVSFNMESNDGEVMHMNERSNGLRWYLNMFINSHSNDIPNKNVLYLFDEPATSLHVNAQKEILKLFDELASRGNQIVYTTHSPSMITTDNGGLHRIRAVDKSYNGYTHIYKTAYDARIAPDNQTDTFAPIVKAIGMDLASTFGPARDKINIVCEGVSDYIYFKTIAKLIGVSNDYNFIPSTGVTNVPNMCNLLLGWNCPFVAVFDYDNEGVEKGGNVMEKRELYKENEDFIYIKNELTKLDFENKTYNVTPYMIEDIIGRDELVKFATKNGLGENALKDNKTILAKFYCTALETENIQLTQTCKEEFTRLFKRIGLIKLTEGN